MRKLSLFLLLSLMSLFAAAQSVEQTYFFEEPVVTEIQSYNQLQFEGCLQTAVAGNPSLPYKSVSLLLPYGSEAESVEVVFSDFEEITIEGQLFPYQPSRAYSNPGRKLFVKNEDLYASKTSYPSKSYGELTTHYLNGHAFAFTSFTPVQYEPSSGKIRYAKTATVRVNLTSAKEDKSDMLWNTPQIKKKIMSMADNPEMIESYATRAKELPSYDLLVITGTNYVSGFEDYLKYYEGIGVRNKIVTVEELVLTVDGRDNQEKIRNYIIDEYSENGISMVLLGGDVNIVPYRGFYCQVQSSTLHVDNAIPADLYFCALDGTWNDNNDNKWGEIGEDDLLPEIGVARMSFDNATKQANMINKSLKYQTEPVMGEFRDIILAGEWLYDNPETYGSDYLELLIGEHDDNGYTTIGVPEDYNFTRHYAENGTWGPELLRTSVNEGVQYVNHVGHANTNTVAEWYNSDITDENFSGLNGVDHNYTFFHSHGCVCGSFDDDCIMERMVSIQNFAVAAIGNSRYGWFNEGQTEGPAAHLHREMIDAQYNDRIPFLGMQLSESKCMTAPFVNAPGQWEEGALRWNFYDLNIMGDVAVRPWIDEPFEPEVEYEEQILVGTQSTEVVVKDNNGVGQEGFRCIFELDGERVAYAVTDENGVAEIDFADGLTTVGDMKLYVVGLNAFPEMLDVAIVPDNAAFVVYDEYNFNDGNANGILDYNESVTMNVVLKNVGSVNAENVTATLTSDKPDHINVTQSTINVGNLNANSTVSFENAFVFTVSDNIPNDAEVEFFIICTDGTDEWESKFTEKIYAPEFEIESPATLELNQGDNETVEFKITNVGGSAAEDVVFTIYEMPEIIIAQNQFVIPSLAAGESADIEVNVSLSETAQQGYEYQMPVVVYSGSYNTDVYYSVMYGSVTEDFETGDFSKFDWEFGGNSDWVITTDNVYAGNYCASSGETDDNSYTSLKITLDVEVESEMSFYKKVSSEKSYDMLQFYIDEERMDDWSGEEDWSLETYTLTEGEHILRWTYYKDVYMSSGSDCAWLDNIKFPPTAIVVDVEELVGKNLDVYPNPNEGTFNIDLGDEKNEVVIYNTMGQVVYKVSGLSGSVQIDLGDVNAGLYFVNIKNKESDITKKIMIM